MKVKLFQCVVNVSAGGFPGGDFDKLETDINNFLASHNKIRVVDIKLSAHAAPVADMVTNYGIQALLLYEDD